MAIKKATIVLEGGATRGIFTSGVLDCLMEKEIYMSDVIGVSAGACNALDYVSRQPGRTRDCMIPDEQYGKYIYGIRDTIRTKSMMNMDLIFDRFPNELIPFDFDTYRNNPLPFYVVATDLETGKAVYHRVDDCDEEGMKWLKASASMPLVSKIVEVDGYKLLDGGIADSIPVQYMESQGYERNVVILTQPEGYVKGKNQLMPMIRVVLRKYPKMIDAMEHRHEHYNETLEYIRKKEKEGDLFVIRPPKPIAVSKVEHDRQKLLVAYRSGRETMKGQVRKLQEFLQ